MPKYIDRTGQIFGRLTVLNEARGGKDRAWRCQCSCGSIVIVQGTNLQSGASTSCGCWHREQLKQRLTRHGGSADGRRTPTYQSWKSMLKRCNNPNDHHWPNYGGRGIRVCDRWHDFTNFLADMGEKPAAGMSIERLNNDLGYQPDNCIWTTNRIQARNKRNTRYVTVCGRRIMIRDACIMYGVPHTSIWTYRAQHKLTLTEAFFDCLDRRV